MGVLILFSLSLFEKDSNRKVLNKPLGLWLLWCGLITGTLWLRILEQTKNYPIKIFLPFFNILCFVIFYQVCVQHLNKQSIERALRYVFYSVIVVSLYALFQAMKIDQFYTGIGSSGIQVVGITGNQSHLAGWLAILTPVFYFGRRIWFLPIVWLAIVFTKSASGIFIAFLSIILYWVATKRIFYLIMLFVSLFVIFTVYVQTNTAFLNPEGRLEIWRRSFDMFLSRPFTGSGIGSFGLSKVLDEYTTHWRHVHQEYLQCAIETGIIGLGLLFWALVHYIKTAFSIRNRLVFYVSLIFVCFCVLGLFSFPAHLWVISVYGMMSYSFIYALKSEDKGVF
jgi:O-antigen ligase